MPIVHRIDRVDAPTWATQKFEKTPEGFLKGQACVTQIGVFSYLQGDNSVVRELRIPEEVFSQESLDSFKLKPITNDHPVEKITAENVKQYSVGNLGENPYNRDNIYLTIDLIIQDAAAIADVMAGKRELSVGYDCEIDPSPGVWGGVQYDVIQRKIRANHVAIVDRARAGDAARIRLDSADAIQVIKKEETKVPDLKKIKIDGVEYEGEAKILESYTTALTKVDTLQTSLTALTAEKTKAEADRDTFKDKAEKLDVQVKELEKNKLDAQAVEAAVARRVKILDAAKLAEVEVTDKMTELDIQKAVILKIFPKAVLDGKDQIYIDARFDGALETFAKDTEENADAATRQLAVDTVAGGKQKVEPEVSAKKARQAYLDRLNKKDTKKE